jgi:hypothetical protein
MHERYAQDLQDYVDGTLGAIRSAELRQHLDQCDACRALLADLQRIHDLAATLDQPAPPDGVWLQVVGRLRQEGRVQAPPPAQAAPRSRTALLAIAAGLLIAIGASLTILFPLFEGAPQTEQAATQPAPRNSEGGDGAATAADAQSIEDHFRIAEQHMQTGIAKLEEAAGAQESQIDAQTAAMLRKNLELIDQAIAESRAALKAEPQSTIARDSLFNALRRKVTLLQETVALMNEMRKGDAAGAAQLIDGINKS